MFPFALKCGSWPADLSCKTLVRPAFIPLIGFLLAPICGQASPHFEETNEGIFITQGTDYHFAIDHRGAILELAIGESPLLAMQESGYLGEAVLRAVAPNQLEGDDGDRSLVVELDGDAISLRFRQDSQTSVERWHFPLAESIRWAVFPADGGQTHPVPINRHLNHNNGARFISAHGGALDTVNRTFLARDSRNLGIFIYPNGHELRLRPLTMAAPTDLLAFELSDFPENHFFDNSTLSLPVTLVNEGSAPVGGQLTASIHAYAPTGPGAVLASETIDLAVPGEGRQSTHMRFTDLPPGPLSYRLSAVAAGHEKVFDGVLMYRMSDWELTDYEPDDFDAFWQSSLEQLRSRPLDPQITAPRDRRNVPEPFKEVSFNGLDGRRIRGFLAIPPDLPEGARVPAIVTCPGAGYATGPVHRRYLDRGWVTLILSVHDLPFGGESGRHHPRELWSEVHYVGLGLESREDYFYRAAYLVPVRGFDFLESLPMVDPSRILVTGGSQGGSMALAAAALEPRFAFVAAAIPGRVHFDLLNSIYTANGTFNIPEGMTRDEMVHGTLAYFDIAHMTPRIRTPTWMNMSLNDSINPGPLQLHAYRTIPAEFRAGFTLATFGGHGEAEGSAEKEHEAIRARLDLP